MTNEELVRAAVRPLPVLSEATSILSHILTSAKTSRSGLLKFSRRLMPRLPIKEGDDQYDVNAMIEQLMAAVQNNETS